jgi:uncharacterized protein (DUF362 family)
MTGRGFDVIERQVVLARSERPSYGSLADPVEAPELATGRAFTVALEALRRLLAAWGLDRDRASTAAWNPLGAFIRPGSRVVLKPNWVSHHNQSGAGLECLVTHPSLIEAVLEYVALARPGEVVLGDAPVQGCDFAALIAACGVDALVARFHTRGLNIRLADFRRSVRAGPALGAQRREDCRGPEQYVLFDLGTESLLEPLSADAAKFRVTMYDPRLLLRAHAPGRHQYLIAREVLEADVVINLPKLKTHKKACITGALKNLVGVNGNKEYLPHHRKGGAASGGDCYPGRSWRKARAEDLLDAANRRQPGGVQALLARSASLALRWARLAGEDADLEGSWYGNDTVWRMCLDLQRILRYGRADGTLGAAPQRSVVTITDAIVAGEGEGPLASTPRPAGFITGAVSPAAADWVHARLMGFDPRRIPLVREAFGHYSYALAPFSPSEIRVLDGAGELEADQVRPPDGRCFRPPSGWSGHCELVGTGDPIPGGQALVA